MPTFLTHWRILIETARQSEDAGSDLGSLIIDAATMRRRAHGWSTPPLTTPTGAVWDTGPLPEIDFYFPGSDISAMAFLGSLAPDIMYYFERYFRQRYSDHYLHTPPSKHIQRPERPRQWSELFHTSRSGDLVIAFLEQLALVPAPALRSQALAFALGYISHIAADLALNPWIDRLASLLRPHRMPGSHFYVELRLDEYLASGYFEHPRYSMLHQPWGDYIEPVARELSAQGTLATQIVQLFSSATEIYELTEEENETLPQDFRQGLKGLKHFLSGQGRFRWLSLQASQRGEPKDLVTKMLEDTQRSEEGLVSLEQVMGYAFRLSEHLCRQALNYYSALRNSQGGASERSSRRTALVHDLRNWNLHTGYSTEVSSNPRLHNWTHFADLWTPLEAQAELSSLEQLKAKQSHSTA